MKILTTFLLICLLKKSYSLQCSLIKDTSRIDCHPEPYASSDRCLSRGCCWSAVANGPYCYYPSDFESYKVVDGSFSKTGYIGMLEKKSPGFREKEILKLQVNVTYDSQKRLRVRITDPNAQRYEVPELLMHGSDSRVVNEEDSNDYSLYINDDPFYMKVFRKSTGRLIFNTNVGPLIYSDQFIQFSTSLVNKNFYGMGEHRDHFAHTTDWQSFTMWNRDVPPGLTRNLYGSHPFYLAIEDPNNAMGFFMLNSNGMDVNVQPSPALTFTTIGGIIDFYLYLGPSPKDIVKQHSEIVGKPFLPPYFTLGFHLCRWKYNNNTNLKQVIQRNREAEIPYDIQWVDIDSMSERLDWTYATDRLSDLPHIVDDLHKHGQHYINIIDPAISDRKGYEPYETGMEANVFIKNLNNDDPIKGVVWPGSTVYPDFTHPNATLWWTKMAKGFHDKIPFDGIWIDMNEPSNFDDGSDVGCPNSTYDNPPYIPKVLDGHLYSKTICPSSRQYLSSHYNLHNMYGHFEAIATFKALIDIRSNKRPFVLTRSTFAGTGQYAAHWSGDNDANWDDLFYSIPNMLNFNMFGVSMVGSDICGFSGNTNEELCIRWMQLGSFYPFMRNHNDDKSNDQDPAVFSTYAQNIIKTALNTRYTLLPYLYNLLFQSHTAGETVVRPLFFEFMSDKNTYLIDKQFMFGPSLLVSPVLKQGASTVNAYFPNETWYKYETGKVIDSKGSWITLAAPLEEINVHVKGGSIVPYQFPSTTTTQSRKNPFGILVALKAGTRFCSADGEMFWDDGESLDTVKTREYNRFLFKSKQTTEMGMLEIMATELGYDSPMKLGEVKVYGVFKSPQNVTINDKIHENFEYNDIFMTLKIQYFTQEMNSKDTLNVSWFF